VNRRIVGDGEHPVRVATGIAAFDIPVALGALLLVVLLLLLRGRIQRPAGAALLLLYVAYAAWRYLG
jgi:Ca2+/Na+ antiporter